METFNERTKRIKKENELTSKWTPIVNDINGNPRYYISVCNVPAERVDVIKKQMHLEKYRGKQYGPGYVSQPYNLLDTAKRLERMTTMSDYQWQAFKFLVNTGTQFDIVPTVPQRAPHWSTDGVHGIQYAVTLKNKRGAYTFDFWDSLHNKEQGNQPNEYDVLACLQVEQFNTFADFADCYGYDQDSRQAYKIYTGIVEQAEQLARIFTRRQLEQLAEIN